MFEITQPYVLVSSVISYERTDRNTTWTPLKKRVLVLCCVIMVACGRPSPATADNPILTRDTDQSNVQLAQRVGQNELALEEVPLDRSLITLSPDELGGIRLIIRETHNTYSQLNSINFDFYGLDNTNTIFKGIYFSIETYQGMDTIKVGQQFTPDCSLLRTQLYKSENGREIYLATSARAAQGDRLIPQYLPAEQRITLFKLLKNEKFFSGKSPLYFSDIYSEVTVGKYCGDSEIDAMLHKFMRDHSNQLGRAQ